MPLRLTYAALRGELDDAFKAMYAPIARAATGAIRDAAAEITTQGRSNIAAAGFPRGFQNALRVEVYPRAGVAAGAALYVHHTIPYAGVFERGADIKGKPLLWIPLPGTPARIGGRRLTPRAYIQAIGPLSSLRSRKGLPILAGPISGRAGTKITLGKLRRGSRGEGNVTLQPIFIGVPSIHIRQRFGLQEIFNRAASGLGAGYIRNLQA
jgi:hypothetical protein